MALCAIYCWAIWFEPLLLEESMISDFTDFDSLDETEIRVERAKAILKRVQSLRRVERAKATPKRVRSRRKAKRRAIKRAIKRAIRSQDTHVVN